MEFVTGIFLGLALVVRIRARTAPGHIQPEAARGNAILGPP